MNRFAQVSNAAGLVMGHYDTRDTYLWKLAQEFTLGDAMFHSAFGGSFLNHAMFVCSCAFRWPNAPADKIAKLDPDVVTLSRLLTLPRGVPLLDEPGVPIMVFTYAG